MPGNTAFHPTIKTLGFQTAFSFNESLLIPWHSLKHYLSVRYNSPCAFFGKRGWVRVYEKEGTTR
jgi:hypothetical protein